MVKNLFLKTYLILCYKFLKTKKGKTWCMHVTPLTK
jgi:hypothetical protein